MTVVPLPTFVPQDAWFNITTGNYNPSVADTVPDVSYLQPSGGQDAIVGPADGAIIGLRGIDTTMDGGQKWLLWDEDSLEIDNGTTVFCPFVDTATPGRWVALGAADTGPGQIQSIQSIQAGQSTNIAAASTQFVQVFVSGPRLDTIETTLALPGATFNGQTFSVKDALGDAGTYNVIITAPSIDGAATFTFYANYQEAKFTWNGSEWSVV